MANKKVSQLVSKPSVLVTDLFPIADPTTGQLFKTTISDLGTAIGSGVSSVNGLVGAVVLDTDDIQELASPTNRWFTDTRARAALSGGTGISYDSGTGVITNAVTSGQIATALGYTPADDALVVKLAGSQTITGTKTFQQAPLMDIGIGYKNGSGVYNYLKSINTGWEMPVNGQNHNLIFSTSTNYVYTFPNASGTIALTSDLSSYVPYMGATANVNLGNNDVTAGSFTGGTGSFATSGAGNAVAINHSSGSGIALNITKSGSGEGIYVNKSSGSGNAVTIIGTLNATTIVKSGGTSSQFLKADGSVDSTAYLKGSLIDGFIPYWNSTLGALTNSFIEKFGNFTQIGGSGLDVGSGMTISGRYNNVANAPKIFSSDESTGMAHISFINTGGGFNLGVNKSTANGLMSGASAYATVLTSLQTTNLEFGTDATKRMTIDGTTGAVTLTSALSGTSATFSKSSNSGSGTVFPRLQVENTLATQGDGSTTFNFADIRIASGNSAVQMFLSTTFAAGNWAPAAIINVATNHDLQFRTNGTEKMRITSSGNVGIGTTSPSERLDIAGNALLNGDGTWIKYSGANAFFGSASTISGGSVAQLGIRSGSEILFATNGATERLRITSSGNVGIGTTAPQGGGGSTDRTLSINSGAGAASFVTGLVGDVKYSTLFTASSIVVLETNAAIPLAFNTNGSERMRITSGGNVLIGTTSSSGDKFEVNGSISSIGSGAAIVFQNQVSTNKFVMFASTNINFYNNGTNTTIASINATTGVYTPISDRNKKKDFEDSTIGLNEVMQLKPTLYRMKSESEDAEKQLGFIAQEVQGIIPSAYQQSGDFIGLNFNPIVAALTKAIQEQQVQIQELKKQLASK